MGREIKTMAKKTKLQSLHTEMQSSDRNKVYKALKDLRKHGTRDSIPLLIDMIVNTDEPMLYDEAIKILNDLKDKESTELIVEAIQKPGNEAEIITLLQVIWQAGLKVDKHLRFLADRALKGDTMVAFECLTIIQHMEDTIEDEEAFDIIADLREAVLREHENEQIIEMIIQELNERVIG